ncbi:hypothetical protein [Sodalis-like endosymbiont of Proechinophthirus fluctus]|uniref:hypothetical protein n=1 Tax=Sodalis-like endosymbiont of Proechinophthirus fluctus TaxID=1462730 RepID=UPI00164F129F|nr:hypothetical protein [Sodalis-like endosymbiont of Proechinophthirus fluctus]
MAHEQHHAYRYNCRVRRSSLRSMTNVNLSAGVSASTTGKSESGLTGPPTIENDTRQSIDGYDCPLPHIN